MGIQCASTSEPSAATAQAKSRLLARISAASRPTRQVQEAVGAIGVDAQEAREADRVEAHGGERDLRIVAEVVRDHA
ncbi:MAG: hypothetical protein U0802_13150 [Candidatus Binatia bacterium]